MTTTKKENPKQKKPNQPTKPGCARTPRGCAVRMRALRARRSVDQRRSKASAPAELPRGPEPVAAHMRTPPRPTSSSAGKTGHKWVEEGALRTRIQTLGKPFSRVLCGAGRGSLGQMHMCFAVVPKSSSPLSFTNPSKPPMPGFLHFTVEFKETSKPSAPSTRVKSGALSWREALEATCSLVSAAGYTDGGHF